MSHSAKDRTTIHSATMYIETEFKYYTTPFVNIESRNKQDLAQQGLA